VGQSIDVLVAAGRKVKELKDTLFTLMPDEPLKQQLVWAKFMNSKEVRELRDLLPLTAADTNAELGASVLKALSDAFAQLDYTSTGRGADALLARNTILAAVVNLEDLQSKRLVTAFGKALGVSQKAIRRAGKRRERLRQDWFTWNR
jgi:hypothetical protein